MVVRILAPLALMVLTAQFAVAQAQNPDTSRAPQPGQAQPNQQQVAQPGQPAGRMQMRGGINDQQLAHWLLVLNQNEIALAEFGNDQFQDEEVKQFAQTLIEDHQKIVSSLRQVTGGGPVQAQASQRVAGGNAETNAGVDGNNADAGLSATPTNQGANPNRDQANPTDGNRRNDAASQPGRQPARQPAAGMQRGGEVGFVQLGQELGYQCFQSSKEELSKKSGAEFDKCYIGMQIAAHMHALDTLKVFRNHASGQLAQAIDQAQPVVQQHLEHAKQLMKKLDNSVAAQADRSDQPRR